jgi:hypothetical protein
VAVLKEVRSLGEVVFVDSGESGQVPDAIRSQLAGTIPVVVITDPKGEKIYGRFDHSQLKSKDFGSIFRKAKKELREDLKKGPAVDPKSAADATNPAGGGSSTTAAKGTPDFAKLPYESWESLHGTKVEAKLEGLQGDDLTLRAKDGRVIKLKRYQLSNDSLKRLGQITG